MIAGRSFPKAGLSSLAVTDTSKARTREVQGLAAKRLANDDLLFWFVHHRDVCCDVEPRVLDPYVELDAARNGVAWVRPMRSDIQQRETTATTGPPYSFRSSNVMIGKLAFASGDVDHRVGIDDTIPVEVFPTCGH